MKKYLFFVLLLLYQLGYSQQITHIQYWFGDDFAGRVLQSVSSNATNQILLDIAFPDNGTNAIDNFFHCRFVDSNDNWSAIYSQQMNNNSASNNALVQVQYWFDTNTNNKTLASINSILVSNVLDHQELDIPWEANAQKLFYRFKSKYNNWTSIQSFGLENAIYQNNQIESIQYWFGNDFAGRVLAPATLNANGEIDFSIAFPDNGSNELNSYFHYRFVDKIGNWSAIYSQQMQNNSNPALTDVEVEYWFDNAFSNRTLTSLSTIASNNLLDHQELDITWTENAQTIHYRFKSRYNQWSSIQSSNIDVIENWDNKIVQIEYWLNDNFATRDTINVNENQSIHYDIRDLNINIDACNPDEIHLRYKDKLNRWSAIYSFNSDYNNPDSEVRMPGITVLVHGFQFFGELTDSTADFKKMGAAIINRAHGGVMYINNTSNGQWEFVQNTGETKYELDYTKEVVLVYDWRDLSNNNTVNIDFGGNGYLEAAADNLFATFLNPPWLELGITKEDLLNKPKHFIAHSRGTIVTLQFLHRLATYFPSKTVDQFTLLDPHPATSFGDMNSNQEGSPPNLPCVNGIALSCISPFGCSTVGLGTYLKIPFNVIRADNYFRRDNQFEDVFDLGAFDGLPVPSLGYYNRELNNINLGIGAPTLGGTHSAVHEWYRGTIDLNEKTAGPHEPELESISALNTLLWYTTASIGSTTTLGQPNNFLQTECRKSTGYNHSRIGGGSPVPEIAENLKESLEGMNKSMALRYGLSLQDYPNGVSPHSVNGGYFDNNNDAGWNKNAGVSNHVAISNGKAEISNNVSHSILKHSLMYFGSNYNFLKLNIYEANSTSANAYPSIKISFFNGNNILMGLPYTRVLNPETTVIYAPIPNDIIGDVGTFQIEYGTETEGSFKVDEIVLIENIPSNNTITINLKLNIEGYYDTSTNQMRPVKMNQGIGSDATVVDDITVELVNPTSLQSVASIVTELKTNGTAICNFPLLNDGNYYLVIKHRNALQTWSATPIYLNSSPMIYDFSDAANKAFGANLIELQIGVFGLYSGDINQDENVDNSDYSIWESDANDFSFGFFATDLNGDGNVDNTDFSIWEANSNNYIFSIHPTLD